MKAKYEANIAIATDFSTDSEQVRLVSVERDDLIKCFIAQEQSRAHLMHKTLPTSWKCPVAWAIILELSAARFEGRQACVKHTYLAANAPAATVHRRLADLEDGGWIDRFRSTTDQRFSYLSLTARALQTFEIFTVKFQTP